MHFRWIKGASWLYIVVGTIILLSTGAWLLSWNIQVLHNWSILQQDAKATAKEKFDASLAISTTLISGIGTIATIVGGIVLYLNFKDADRKTAIEESRLISERFSKAVEQLGHERIEVRLGGIYALERISEDSDKYYWVVMEVLTSFIQEKSPQELIPERFLNIIGFNQPGKLPTQELPQVNELPIISKDIQAALTVIGRRNANKDPQDKFIELHETNLSIRAKLAGANFKKARLWEANIIQSDLRGADLSEADLEAATLSLSDLRKANLSKSCLVQADLRRTNLTEANLSEANLSRANFIGVVGLRQEQVKQAKNWEEALYDNNFREQLGLP